MGFRITILSMNMTNQSHRIGYLIPGPLIFFVFLGYQVGMKYNEASDWLKFRFI